MSLKESTKKGENQNSKSWITSGIKECIKVRGILYKKTIKEKKNAHLKQKEKRKQKTKKRNNEPNKQTVLRNILQKAYMLKASKQTRYQNCLN